MHLQNSSLVSQLPMEYDQKQLGISLQRWVPFWDIECHRFFVISASLKPLQQNLVES